MLTDEIQKAILSQKFTYGQKLPSIRKMSHLINASTGSVCKVYQNLVKEGKVKAYTGKGFFWGDYAPVQKIKDFDLSDSLETLFKKDMESGALSAFTTFPTLKEFSKRYGTSLYHIRNFINEKIQQGILKRIGTSISFNEEKKISRNNYILFIHRSNGKGHFSINSERELDVFRTLTQFTEEQKISIRYIGYHEETDELLTPDGLCYTPQNDPNCFGAFISTWLIMKPTVLFSHFAKNDFPISVWWEHSTKSFPKSTLSRQKWAFFNVAFNKDAGRIVGDLLKNKHIAEAYYLSPFHANDWSHKRLEGLQTNGTSITPLINNNYTSPFEIMMQAKRLGIDPDRLIEKIITELLPEDTQKPFVCANDWVAAVLIEILESRGQKRPYIIGFDNTTESYRYIFDSFSFNVEAMVKEALYHIISPTTYASLKKQIQNLPGKIIIKG